MNQLNHLTSEFDKKSQLNSNLIHKRNISTNSSTPFNLSNKPSFSTFINSTNKMLYGF